jgi:hypothetical protein
MLLNKSIAVKSTVKSTAVKSFVPQKEAYYQRILENVLKGSHKKIPSGITDVTTSTLHAEIKKWPKWRHAVGQLLSYNVFDEKPNLQIYLFNHYSPKAKLIALSVFQVYGIRPFEFVEDYEADKLKIMDLIKNKCIFEDSIKLNDL